MSALTDRFKTAAGGKAGAIGRNVCRVAGVAMHLLLLSACELPAENAPAAPPAVRYARDIQPIFSENCGASCHLVQGGGNTGLNLQPGFSWEALVGVEASTCTQTSELRVEPGNPEASVLWRRVSGDVDHCGPMPPGGPLVTLDPDAVARIAEWIREGAPNN